MIKKFLALTLCVLGFGCFTSGLIACKSDNSSGEGNNYTFESAYEQATALGYAGTLEEFIIQISGKDGVDGQDGKDGEDGQDGKDGEDGQDGLDGKDGADGQDGKDGLDGKDGIGIKNVFINADGDLIVELTARRNTESRAFRRDGRFIFQRDDRKGRYRRLCRQSRYCGRRKNSNTFTV